MPVTEEILEQINDLDGELLGGDEKARELPRALRGGTMAMRSGVPAPQPSMQRQQSDDDGTLTAWTGGATKWLPPEPAETEEEYRYRVWNSYLTPFYTDAIDLNVGRVFAKAPTLDEKADKRIVTISENISMLGDHWTQVARDRFWEGLHEGVSYILVDHPPVPANRSTAATDEKLRPYWVTIDADQTLGIGTVAVDSSIRLAEFRYCERAAVRKGLMTVYVDRVRRFVAGDPGAKSDEERLPKLQTFEKQGDDWRQTDETLIRRPAIAGESADVRAVEEAYFIPIVAVYGRRKGAYRGRPYFRDLAELCLQHFQKRSDLDRILHSANIPLLFGSGFDTNNHRLTLGALRAILNELPESDLKYVEHTGQAIKAAMEDLDSLEARLAVASLEPLIKRATGSETATAKLIDEAKGHSVLSALALGLQDSLENAFKFTANWMGMADGPSVSVNTDFGVSMRDAQELQVLLNAALASKLSTKTFLSEVRRRGIISEEINIDTELEEIGREGPSLGEIGEDIEQEAA